MCPNAWVFTCIDCGKEFEGFEFQNHNECKTEAEKYQGKLYQPKAPPAWKGWRNEIKAQLKQAGKQGISEEDLKERILARYLETEAKLPKEEAERVFGVKLRFKRFIKEKDKVYFYKLK